VQEALNPKPDLAYTTVQTMLNILQRKGQANAARESLRISGHHFKIHPRILPEAPRRALQQYRPQPTM
jgi:predicted transcriptional regulator